MMERLASFIRKADVWIVLGIVSVSIYSGFSIFNIGYNDDITAFFPEGSREVELFKKVGKKFGGLDIALVGIEADDIFTLSNLRLIRAITRKIQLIDGVGSVTSITEMRDFEEKKIGSEVGSIVQDLIGDLSDGITTQEIKRIREAVLSRQHLVGSMVSKNGDATLIICKLESSSGLWKVADTIKKVTDEAVAGRNDVKVYYGGAPFVSSYIMSGTQNDLKKLSPWVALVIVLIVFFTFRSIVLAFIALFAIMIGLVLTVGFMPIVGIEMDLVSTSLPMILASIGSAYGIHLLARYYRVVSINPQLSGGEAVTCILKEVGVPVIMAGITTIVGFASFLVMDIEPLRNFGFMMTVGVFFTLAVSILIISSIVGRMKIKKLKKIESGEITGEALYNISSYFASHSRFVIFCVVVIVIISVYFITRISTQTSTASYFPSDSEPVRADRFMVDKFGGSLFLQLYLKGDIKNPVVLKEIQKMEGEILAMDGVTDVQSIVTPITLGNASLSGNEEIPLLSEQVASLAYLIEDDPAVRLLVDKEWKSALMQVRVGGFDTKKAKQIAEKIKDYIKHKMRRHIYEVGSYRVKDDRLREKIINAGIDDYSVRLWRGLDNIAGIEVSLEKLRKLLRKFSQGFKSKDFLKDVRGKVEESLYRNLKEDELIYIDEAKGWDELVNAVCEFLLAGKMNEESLYRLLFDYATEEEKENELKEIQQVKSSGKDSDQVYVTGFRKSVRIVLSDIKSIYLDFIVEMFSKQTGIEESIKSLQESKKRKILGRLRQNLAFISNGRVILSRLYPGVDASVVENKADLSAEVTGYPLLYEKMNDSVVSNQVKSIFVALVIIYILVSMVFRSLVVGLIATFPACITLIIVFGALGASTIPMDMGVSMVSIIALGASIDYPIHFFWRYREVCSMGFYAALLETMKTTGRAIAVNAMEVMSGFSILLFAVVTPVRKAGGMIAIALFMSAFATLLLMPVLIKVAEKKVHEKLMGGGV